MTDDLIERQILLTMSQVRDFIEVQVHYCDLLHLTTEAYIMSVATVYRIEQDKLFLESQRIGLFTTHPTVLGSFREQLLREYLRRFTPAALEMRTGFAAKYREAQPQDVFQEQSRQIDCLICDLQRYVPFLSANEYVIVQPEAVCAAIEVKSELTLFRKSKQAAKDIDDDYPFEGPSGPFRWEGTLIDALRNIARTAEICSENAQHHFSGVFAFQSHSIFGLCTKLSTASKFSDNWASRTFPGFRNALRSSEVQ